MAGDRGERVEDLFFVDDDITGPPTEEGQVRKDGNDLKIFIGGTVRSLLAGSGDVIGPGGATDEAVARFDGVTGKLLQDSAVTIDDAGNIATPGTVDGRDVSADGAKLDTVEVGATADQVASEVPNDGTAPGADVATALGSLDTRTTSLEGDRGRVFISADDTTTGFLNGKLVAGNRVALIEQTPGASETLRVDVTNDDFSAYEATGQQSFTGGVVTLALDNERFVSSSTYSLAANGEVTLTVAGRYEITADVVLNPTSNSTSEAQSWLELNGSEIAGTRMRFYFRRRSGNSASASLLIDVAANDVLRIRAQRTRGNGQIQTSPNGTRLNIKKVN